MSLFWIAIKNLRVLIDQYSFYMSLSKDVNYLMNFYILIPFNIMHLNFYIHSITNIHISQIVISNAKSSVVVFFTPKYISFIFILHSIFIFFLLLCVYLIWLAEYQYPKHTFCTHKNEPRTSIKNIQWCRQYMTFILCTHKNEPPPYLAADLTSIVSLSYT